MPFPILEFYSCIIDCWHIGIEYQPIFLQGSQEIIISIECNRFNSVARGVPILHLKYICLLVCGKFEHSAPKCCWYREFIIFPNDITICQFGEAVPVSGNIIPLKCCSRFNNPEGSIIFNLNRMAFSICKCKRLNILCFFCVPRLPCNLNKSNRGIVFSGYNVVFVSCSQLRCTVTIGYYCRTDQRLMECKSVNTIIRVHILRILSQTILLQHG